MSLRAILARRVGKIRLECKQIIWAITSRIMIPVIIW